MKKAILQKDYPDLDISKMQINLFKVVIVSWIPWAKNHLLQQKF
jgi:hypothetical protein